MAEVGVTDIVKEITNPTLYKIFNLLITDKIMDDIIFQTYLCATQE